ncbi:MAG: long-chain-acyl-CoA synthetase [Myxococcota bacterium]|jgi:fatty-acyl-CoA synthase|nr:long-chain-acyl-CoA synthetase [Deltaproteobacteria bacterium]MCP4243795.1 long-chain-acyl-CoA synthetase [bacterium]MDP7073264.1 long-chain-acyl-CoA synthetase [Myxococcota bacterium]MDP7300815.1 long-chain-acyl-CoA synthetase [Myxococcota bacterium]MDP7433112.1 long-chain-acyl-CoA synthetase [Myxococcota bacterium]
MPASLFVQRLRILGRSLRWMPGIALAGPGSRRTTADLIERAAERHPHKSFVRFEGRDRSYCEYNARANRIAHWALARGVGKGDVVALLMENRPEQLEAWAGLAKAGATTALLNTNLRGSSLSRVLQASGCKTLILGSECIDAWVSVGPERPAGLEVLVAEDPRRPAEPLPPAAKSLDEETAGYSDRNLPRSVRADLRGADPLFYIYTSGTTGLPKAARFSHARFMGGGLYGLLSGMTGRDTLYCALPLYHTVGGVMCVNAVLRSGGTLALARRFSAGRFWQDVVEMDATGFQYIGEVCRYLLAVPPSDWETRHRIRFCVGNGLRPDIWEAFQQRFAIPHISEFYGATESNVSLVNLEGVVGSVGRPAPGTAVALVRWNVAKQEHQRTADGRCIAAGVGETGELLGKISEGRTAAGRFEGYTDPKATEKKILHAVFEAGDAWFRTGDLLRRDARGSYYFVDRIGDTFRWKGENVSTQEVAEALTRNPDVELAAVYGVEIPGCEGRSGMAALVLAPECSFDGRALYAHVAGTLPAYARPAFLRVQTGAELTGTFKVRKVELQAEGFDPDRVNDPLYCRDDATRIYKPLTPQTLAAIQSGELRF